jgi:hypothetical protein
MKGVGTGIEVRIGGDIRVPRGGIVVAAPGVGRRWKAAVNGRPIPVSSAGEVVARAVPATIVLRP